MYAIPKSQNFPIINENILIYFVTYCAESLNLTYHTIKSYLCGIRYTYISNGFHNPLESTFGKPLLQLEIVLKGIRKLHTKPTVPRLPITINILKGICSLLDRGFSGHFEDTCFKAVCLMAFFAFLRCGEFTCISSFDPSSNLCLSDVEFQFTEFTASAYILNLKVSKTDPFRTGCKLSLFRINSVLCPVSAMLKYMKLRRSRGAISTDPLFVNGDNQPLTRTYFLHTLRSLLSCLGVNSSLYAGHSFRRGAASMAAKANVPDHLIKVLGRWSSDCYQRYIDTPRKLLIEAQNKMAMNP